MYLKRKIYERLLQWKQRESGQVLEVEGSRQVGKTYILKKFAEENFTQVIYISMAEETGRILLKCYQDVFSLERINGANKHPLKETLRRYEPNFSDTKDTIIVIDEIQESSLIYNQIRTLAREFDAYVIVTGSYLGKILQDDFFLPAGDMERIRMETLTFEEFVCAFDQHNLYETIDLFGKSTVEEYEKLKELYTIYEKIGGYPAVVVEYMKTKSLESCYNKIKGLMDVFINESKRYFTDIKDVNIFPKLLNGIALLMIKEKKGVRDLTKELSKIVYQSDSGRTTKQMVNNAISWLQESHIVGYASKSIDCSYLDIKENARYYFMDMGIAYYFLRITGATFDEIKGLLAENFVYLSLVRKIETERQIAGNEPWFAVYDKTQGELDFYVRSIEDYRNYGIEVKSTDSSARTARALLKDKKLDYLYLLKGDMFGGISDADTIMTSPLFLADRISFKINS